MHESSDEFKFRSVWTTDCGVSCPWASEKSPQAYNGKNDVSTFSRLFLIGSFSYLQVMITYMRAWMSLKFGQIQPLVSMVTDRVMIGKNGVSTFPRLFFIGFFSYLQVMMTCVRAQTISNFGLIRPPTAALAALERLKKIPIGL